MTPTTTYGCPSSGIERPTTDGSAPNRRCQSEWLSTTRGSRPGSSSPCTNVRPTSGGTPRRSKRSRRDLQAAHALRPLTAAEGGAPRLRRTQPFERADGAAIVEVVGRRDRTTRRWPVQRDDQAVGLVVRQRSKENRVDDREDGGGRPDSERQGEDGEQCEAGLAAEHPAGIAKVPSKRVHVSWLDGSPRRGVSSPGSSAAERER